MEFVGKAISTSLGGIRGQSNFGPVLVEFVGKGFGLRVSAIGFLP